MSLAISRDGEAEGARWQAVLRSREPGAGWFLSLWTLAWFGGTAWMFWTREQEGVPLWAIGVMGCMGIVGLVFWGLVVFGQRRLTIEGRAEAGRVVYEWVCGVRLQRKEMLLAEVVSVGLDAPMWRNGQPKRLLAIRVADRSCSGIRFGTHLRSEKLEDFAQMLRGELKRRGATLRDLTNEVQLDEALRKKFDLFCAGGDEEEEIDWENQGNFSRIFITLHGVGVLLGFAMLTLALGFSGLTRLGAGWSAGDGLGVAVGVGLLVLSGLPGALVVVWLWGLVAGLERWVSRKFRGLDSG